MIMKTKAILLGTAALMFVLTSEKAIAQIGTPYIHDPSHYHGVRWINIILSAQVEADDY